MTTIAELDQHIGHTVSGYYRVLRIIRQQWERAGNPIIDMMIADATGKMLCQLPLNSNPIDPSDSIVVHIQGTVATTGLGKIFIRARKAEPVTQSKLPSWHLIPRCWVPTKALPAFDQLRSLLDNLNNHQLQDFMSQLLADESISQPYLRVPGSRKHHHARPGGLLIHSVECADAAAKQAAPLLPDHELALVIVGALLHDIAKIKILVSQNSSNQAVYGVTQEALNLEILAPYLPELDTAWLAGGIALREILAPYNPTQHCAPLLLTDIVRYADRISAGADLRKNRFGLLPNHQRCTRTEQGQLLARVLPPQPQQKRASVARTN